jgi:hypothetical protein
MTHTTVTPSLSGAPPSHQDGRYRICPHRLSTLLAASIVLFGADPSFGREVCKPRLAFKQVRFSEPQNLQRRWTAVLDVDASACAATSGRFEINFLREKEDAPELEFSAPFTWQTGEVRSGQIEVSIDFWIDEAAHAYAVGYVTPCGCRN